MRNAVEVGIRHASDASGDDATAEAADPVAAAGAASWKRKLMSLLREFLRSLRHPALHDEAASPQGRQGLEQLQQLRKVVEVVLVALAAVAEQPLMALESAANFAAEAVAPLVLAASLEAAAAAAAGAGEAVVEAEVPAALGNPAEHPQALQK